MCGTRHARCRPTDHQLLLILLRVAVLDVRRYDSQPLQTYSTYLLHCYAVPRTASMMYVRLALWKIQCIYQSDGIVSRR